PRRVQPTSSLAGAVRMGTFAACASFARCGPAPSPYDRRKMRHRWLVRAVGVLAVRRCSLILLNSHLLDTFDFDPPDPLSDDSTLPFAVCHRLMAPSPRRGLLTCVAASSRERSSSEAWEA